MTQPDQQGARHHERQRRRDMAIMQVDLDMVTIHCRTDLNHTFCAGLDADLNADWGCLCPCHDPEEDLCHCGVVLDSTGRCWYCDRAAGWIWTNQP